MEDHIKKAPLRRHPNLIPLSREHHHALLLVWKIRQGLKRGTEPKRISDYVAFFDSHLLRAHFQEEEQALFSKLDNNDPLKIRAFQEHHSLQTAIDSLQSDPENTQSLESFADMLERHIRFEERELFGHIQNQLQLPENLQEHKSADPGKEDIDADWQDHFWVNNSPPVQNRPVTAVVLWLLLTTLLFACTQSGQTSGSAHDDAHEDHTGPETTEVTLNNGQKWKADSSTNLHVQSMLEVLSGTHPTDLDAYRKTGNDLQKHLQELIAGCKMQGPDHDALHLWLYPVLNLNKKLRAVEDSQVAEVTYAELAKRIRQYPEYFE